MLKAKERTTNKTSSLSKTIEARRMQLRPQERDRPRGLLIISDTTEIPGMTEVKNCWNLKPHKGVGKPRGRIHPLFRVVRRWATKRKRGSKTMHCSR